MSGGSGTGTLAASAAAATIETLENILLFLGISNQYFEVNASNNSLRLSYDGGTITYVEIPDGTYDGTSIATALQTAMNSTLSMSGTVAWSSTTRKFTLNAGASHTLSYTHTGSDAGLLMGFDADHLAAQTLTSDNAIGDPTAIVSMIHLMAEELIVKMCNRTFVEVAYKERYDGLGDSKIILKQFPVTSIERLAIWPQDVMSVRNTDSSAHSTVSVTSTGIVLRKSGVSNSSVTFASYATMGAIVTAINAVGSGWEASLAGSDFTSYASTELIEKMGIYCGRSSWAYLQIPEEGEYNFDIDAPTGIINLNGAKFPTGIRNIFVDYHAGYTETSAPTDLKIAIRILTKYLYQKRDEEGFGARSFSSSGTSVSYEDGFPFEVKFVVDKYKTTSF